MSKIKNMISEQSSIWAEFPDIEGFEINLKYLTREDLMKVRNASLTYKFNKRTRQREEEVDNDRFLENYAERAILGWKGLKIKHMPALMPVDISGTIFDQFVTDTMNDFEQFSKKKAETDTKN